MRPPEFNFVPANTARTIIIDQPVATITKQGFVCFSKHYVQTTGLEGKFVKFFTDINKRALGWIIRPTLDDLNLLRRREWRTVKKQGSGSFLLQVRSALLPFEILGTKCAGLEVKQYKDRIYGKVHYIQIPRVKKEVLTPRDKMPLGDFLADIHADNNQPDTHG